MGLQVVLKIDRKELLIGENPACGLTLKNTGPTPIEVAHPDFGVGMFSYRSVKLLSGEEELSKGGTPVRGEQPEMVPLGPGEDIQTFISLAEKIILNVPGDYAISAIYNIDDGQEPVESNVVRIKLRHFSVRNPYLPAAPTSRMDAVFINPSVDPPEVMLAGFELSAGGGLQNIKSLAKSTLGSRPYVSLPPNKNHAEHQWIAWIEESNFKAVFLDGLSENHVETLLQLDTNKASIIPPLSIGDMGSSPSSNGAALVWMEGQGTDEASIRRIDLTLSKEGANASASWSYNLPGERPRWMTSHLLSTGVRVMTFIRPTANGGLGLYLLPWPDQNLPPLTLATLVDWPQDEFVAAGATLNDDDEICGATLAWNKGQGKKILELVVWQVDAEGHGEELYRDVIPWSPNVPIESAKVKVRPDGTPAVLMRSDDTKWTVWDGQNKNMTPVPTPFTDTKKSIDIAFMDHQEIIIICADMLDGFAIKKMDGSDLPPAFY